MDFIIPLADEALLSVPAVVIIYILLFALASFEVKQKNK
tara:strand:+ start:1084 stop:1200 length:117 start_codon:yes stop_codon:yes gene_type:complete